MVQVVEHYMCMLNPLLYPVMVIALYLHPQDQAEDHVQSQGETWFREAEPLEQEYMKNGDMPSDANIEELWNELNEMEQPHVQNTAVSL